MTCSIMSGILNITDCSMDNVVKTVNLSVFMVFLKNNLINYRADKQFLVYEAVIGIVTNIFNIFMIFIKTLCHSFITALVKFNVLKTI